MTNISKIQSDPHWLPHEFDPQSGLIRFIKIDRKTTEAIGFLAEVSEIEAEARFPVRDVAALGPNHSPAGFIFHSGFCRSTLLMRSLQYSGKTVCLNEPEILNSLSRIKSPDQKLVDAIIALLSRPWSDGETVIIKPSNFSNRLIPQIL